MKRSAEGVGLVASSEGLSKGSGESSERGHDIDWVEETWRFGMDVRRYECWRCEFVLRRYEERRKARGIAV